MWMVVGGRPPQSWQGDASSITAFVDRCSREFLSAMPALQVMQVLPALQVLQARLAILVLPVLPVMAVTQANLVSLPR